MDVGVVVRHHRDGMARRFQEAAGHGFRTAQLVSWEPALWTEAEAARLKAEIAAAGLTITAFWCGWEGPRVWDFVDGPETLGLVPQAYRAMRVKNLCDGADFARMLGVSDVVTHLGFIPENAADPLFPGLVAATRVVAGHLKAQGQNLLLETGQETPTALLRLAENVGTGNILVNLDPANLLMYGKANPVDALQTIGHLVRGVHAKDGRYPQTGDRLGEETPLGRGLVDFKALIAGLKARGYTGSLTIEREIEGAEQTRDILLAKAYLEDILKGA